MKLSNKRLINYLYSKLNNCHQMMHSETRKSNPLQNSLNNKVIIIDLLKINYAIMEIYRSRLLKHLGYEKDSIS